jgi:hypothetical protein
MDRLVGNDHLVKVILTSWWVISKSISTATQYVTLDNKIQCLSIAVFLATPPLRL